MQQYGPAYGEQGYGTRSLDGIVGATLHYTAGPSTQTAAAVAAYQASQAAIAQTGVGRPFPGLAYSLFAEGDGRVVLAHDLSIRVWHSAAVVKGFGRNYTHVGICYAGNVAPNEAQKAGIRRAIGWLEWVLGRKLEVEGHRDAPYSTACPGPAWPGWREQVLP